jgi:hypothetical protein
MSIEDTIMGFFYEYDAKARALYPAYAARPIPKVTFFAKGSTNGWAKLPTWLIMRCVGVQAMTVSGKRFTARWAVLVRVARNTVSRSSVVVSRMNICIEMQPVRKFGAVRSITLQ